jgi:hypothetical protein
VTAPKPKGPLDKFKKTRGKNSNMERLQDLQERKRKGKAVSKGHTSTRMTKVK